MYRRLSKDKVQKILDIILDTFKLSEENINNLNVFPVPDGDTGTNMLLTLKSIKEEVNKSENHNLKNLAESVSFGALMGARGNSGVILSQILKGFFDIIKKYEDLDLSVLSDALDSSKKLAYESVQNPTEGTMLTTIKDISQLIEEMVNGDGEEIDVGALMEDIIRETERSVTRTTYLLPVLKQADVVDAGAKGILIILQGFRKGLVELGIIKGSLNKKNKAQDSSGKKPEPEPAKGLPEHEHQKNLGELNVSTDIKYTYCTELIVKGESIEVGRLRDAVESYGDSAMVVGNDKLVKIHVHTNHPHKVLQRSLREGSLHDIQINNMVEQSRQAKILEGKEDQKPAKKVSVVAVANGDGLTEIFKSIGTDYIIRGGQTMNPSTYDMVKIINEIEAEKIIVLPNNKNIIPTAKQAKRISKKDIEIIPTKSVVQGITALLNYNPDLDTGENVNNMEKAIETVKSGEVTAAVRDANLVVGEIKKGEYIGLYNGKVRVISDNAVDATLDLVRDMVNGDEEVVTFYSGKDSKKVDREKIRKKIEKYFPELDIEFHNGGQPLYPYIFSIE